MYCMNASKRLSNNTQVTDTFAKVLFYPMHCIYDSAFPIFRALAIDCFARFAQHIAADDDTVQQRYEDSMVSFNDKILQW